MSGQPWHKRYHSDALTGFMSLTLEERGAYQTLLDLIYDRGGPIVDNDRLLAGYMGVSLRKWSALRDSLVVKGKIQREKGLIINRRAISEIENAAKTSRKHAENGSKGGRKSGEVRKYANENNNSGQAALEAGSSLIRSQKPEEAKASSAGARDADFSTVEFSADLCHEVGVLLPDHGAAESNRQVVERWLATGADHDLIRKVVNKRRAAMASPPRSLAYFDNPVREAAAARGADDIDPSILRMAEGILAEKARGP